MKKKAYVLVLVAVLLGLAFAKSWGEGAKSQNDTRLAKIQNYLEALRQREASPAVRDNMPGTQPSLESKLVPLLAEELLSQQEELAALNKRLEKIQERTKGRR